MEQEEITADSDCRHIHFCPVAFKGHRTLGTVSIRPESGSLIFGFTDNGGFLQSLVQIVFKLL